MSDRIFAATRKGLFEVRRTQGRWRIANTSFLGDSVSLVSRPAANGTVYAALGLGHFGVKLRASSDGGQRWNELAAPAFPKQPDGVVDTLPDGKPWPWRVEQIWALEGVGDTLWCGTIGGGLFRSDDGGRSWELVRSLWEHPMRKQWFGGGTEMPGIHSICPHPKNAKELLIGVSCGGVWRTLDGGASWEVTSHGMFAEYMPPERREDPVIQDPHMVSRCAAHPDRLWSQHHNGVFRSDNGGTQWETIPESAPSVFGFAIAAHPTNPDIAWRVPAIKDEVRVPVQAHVVVSRTRDAGKSWEVLREGLPQEHAYDLTFRHALDVDASGERVAFGSTTGSLWVSENSGDSWAHVSAHLPPVYAVRFA
ncbi:exo-alpha-sialidase [Hyalangium sp.]|uniref:WD40/YVTN/BNR-like repeat-containing protein n=1 Tax=Hyalangium sp. TaxID=2028555 RepID=UPI002D6E5169|nr:exo-alpha-sialidase [Hyalangium sp.]HYI01825.1 exo-alpha-sialidase [Hyalangium sp.]